MKFFFYNSFSKFNINKINMLTPVDVALIFALAHLTSLYAETYQKTWTTLKVVSMKDDGEEYDEMEIPDNSTYIKKASKDLPMYIVDGLYIVFTGGVFSNWFPCIIRYGGNVFYSSEQLFMYLKATITKYHKDHSKGVSEKNAEIAKKILKCRCPKELQKLGRALDIDISAWNANSAKHLAFCIFLKFTQNDYLMEFLKTIIDNELRIVEGNGDTYYGNGVKDFDPSNSEHLIPDNWKGKMKLTDIFNEVIDMVKKL